MLDEARPDLLDDGSAYNVCTPTNLHHVRLTALPRNFRFRLRCSEFMTLKLKPKWVLALSMIPSQGKLNAHLIHRPPVILSQAASNYQPQLLR